MLWIGLLGTAVRLSVSFHLKIYRGVSFSYSLNTLHIFLEPPETLSVCSMINSRLMQMILDPTSGSTADYARAMGRVWFAFTPELRDRTNEGEIYEPARWIAPETEIQPSFEEMWNGFLAMYRAIEDFNMRNAPTPPPVCDCQCDTSGVRAVLPSMLTLVVFLSAIKIL